MQRIETTLQLLQDDDILNLHRHRFSESPPPYESPPTTEPPTPLALLAQRSAYERDELFHEPLNSEELYELQIEFREFNAGNRFTHEEVEEHQRIQNAYSARDEKGRQTYSGPDLGGRAGGQRCRIMIRNSIRKRWERLGVWNPLWGIPGRVNAQKNDEESNWRWESTEPPSEQKSDGWPSMDQETASDRAIRQFVQEKGRWNEQNGITQYDGKLDIDSRELFITSRPWFQYKLEIAEEAQRLDRVQRSCTCETAAANTRTRWQHDRRWKDTWHNGPGWKWPHESPSPEPEDPNNMDFSPSEIDALDAIPPPTPPKPRSSIPLSSVSLFGSQPEQHKHTTATQGTDEPKHIRQPSTKRKRQNELLRHEYDDAPVIKRAKNKRTSNRRNESSKTPMGTMWVDTTPSTNRSRHEERFVKVRRSARLVQQNASSMSTGIRSQSETARGGTGKTQKKRLKKPRG